MSNKGCPTGQPDLESKHLFFGWTERTSDWLSTRLNISAWWLEIRKLKPLVQPGEAHPCAVMKKKLLTSLFQTTPKRRNEDSKTLKMSTRARPTDQPDLESQHHFFGWTERTFDFRHNWIYPHDDLKQITDPPVQRGEAYSCAVMKKSCTFHFLNQLQRDELKTPRRWEHQLKHAQQINQT